LLLSACFVFPAGKRRQCQAAKDASRTDFALKDIHGHTVRLADIAARSCC